MLVKLANDILEIKDKIKSCQSELMSIWLDVGEIGGNSVDDITRETVESLGKKLDRIAEILEEKR